MILNKSLGMSSDLDFLTIVLVYRQLNVVQMGFYDHHEFSSCENGLVQRLD